MLYVNNDDMDELFRDAADRYPLKTEGIADWDKVSASLKTEAGTAFADAGEFRKEKKRRVFFWWILLLPLGWIGHYSWQKINGPADEKNLNGGTKTTEMASVSKANEKMNNPDAASENVVKNNVEADKKKTMETKIVVPKSFKISLAENLNDKNQRFSIGIRDRNSLQEKNILRNKNTAKEKNILADHKVANHKDVLDNGIVDNNQKEKVIINGAGNKNDEAIKNDHADIPAQKNKDLPKTNSTAGSDASVKKTKSPVQAVADNKQQVQTTVKLKKDFHFYAGLMAGIDISTIKFQSIEGVGNSVGLLVGYHFSKSRFNIETGVYWDTKKYYTKGEYFDKRNFSYLQQADVHYLDGSCNMFEIPINVRYNFVQHKNTTLFAIAGLSSYIMNKESYGYSYSESGWPGSWYSKQSYYRSTQNWFSILNLSAGYQHRLGKIGDIRIEPYAKLPLSGIGKGNLSIMSAGLNVGLSRRF